MSLEILPVKKIKDGRPQKKLNPLLPKPPFLWNLVAGVKSGKSVFIVNMIYNKNFYLDHFETIYWISPSVMNDATTWSVREDEDVVIITDLENIDQILLSIVEDQAAEDEPEDVLIILDDALGYLNQGGGLDKLAAKFRHYRISLFVTIQNFRKIPITARYNATHWSIWHLNSNNELSKLEDEMDSNFPDFRKYYEEATRKKYAFMFISMKDMVIRENFGKILYSKELASEPEVQGDG